jgi:hypothetical protein
MQSVQQSIIVILAFLLGDATLSSYEITLKRFVQQSRIIATRMWFDISDSTLLES